MFRGPCAAGRGTWHARPVSAAVDNRHTHTHMFVYLGLLHRDSVTVGYSACFRGATAKTHAQLAPRDTSARSWRALPHTRSTLDASTHPRRAMTHKQLAPHGRPYRIGSLRSDFENTSYSSCDRDCASVISTSTASVTVKTPGRLA